LAQNGPQHFSANLLKNCLPIFPASANTSTPTQARCLSPAGWPSNSVSTSTKRDSSGRENPSRATHRERRSNDESADRTLLSSGRVIAYDRCPWRGSFCLVVAVGDPGGCRFRARCAVWATPRTRTVLHNPPASVYRGLGVSCLGDLDLPSQYAGRGTQQFGGGHHDVLHPRRRARAAGEIPEADRTFHGDSGSPASGDRRTHGWAQWNLIRDLLPDLRLDHLPILHAAILSGG